MNFGRLPAGVSMPACIRHKGTAIVLLILFTGMSCMETIEAEVYRWIDEQGNVVYGDRPPKDRKLQPLPLRESAGRGTSFATPEQIEKLHASDKTSKGKSRSADENTARRSTCQRYRSDLNEVEIYLQHTWSQRDALRARDLRKLIRRECTGVAARLERDSSRCRGYRRELLETEIYLEHTPNPRDQQRVQDLEKQIERECR